MFFFSKKVIFTFIHHKNENMLCNLNVVTEKAYPQPAAWPHFIPIPNEAVETLLRRSKLQSFFRKQHTAILVFR